MQFDEQDIWRYVTGKMSTEEHSKFSSLIAENPELQSQIKDESTFVRFLEQKEAKEQAFKNLAQVHEQYTNSSKSKAEAPQSSIPAPKKKTSPTIIRWIGTLALAASLILGILYIIGLNKTSPDPEILFAQSFNPSEISLSVRGSNNIEGLEEVLELYNAQNYNGALELLDGMPIPDEYEDQILYLKGISLLSADRSDAARNTFDSLIEKNPNYKDDATWYKALSHLKDGDISRCISLLKALPADYTYASQAQKILKSLE